MDIELQNQLITESSPRRGLAPARQNDLYQEVANRLREAILQGRFLPGERLREAELAAMLEVSRGPVREALAQLEHEGLVITQRNRGASVARLSQDDAEEVKSLRLALERLAVQMAIYRCDENDLVEMEREIAHLRSGMSPRTTVQEIAEFEVRFHDRLYRAARHKRLYQAWSALRAQVHIMLLSRNVDEPGIRDVVIHRHAALLDALRARDNALAIARIEDHIFGFTRDAYRAITRKDVNTPGIESPEDR
jgi:DNA-binding GntR family transcriptional regulator